MKPSKELVTVSGALRHNYSGRELANKPLNLTPSLEYLAKISLQYVAEQRRIDERRRSLREANYR